MKKIEKDLYIQHAKRLQAILDDKSTFVSFLNRADFKQTIKNELNVLAACEKIFTKVEIDAKLTSTNLTKQFNKLTKESFKLDENFKYDDQTDLIDAINYLVTFCNNMFKVNLDDLVAGKNVTATDPHIDLKAKPDLGDEAPRMNTNFAFAGGIPLATTPYENPYLVGKAYAKLTDDMKQGKFYRYKTKPRIIPIVKWISVILMIILSVSLIVAAVFAFMSNGLQVTLSGDTEVSYLGGISSGIFYLVVAGFCCYPTVMLLKTMVGKSGKNENFKYHYGWGMIMMALLLTLLIVMLDIGNTVLLERSATIEPGQGSKYIGFVGWKIMFIVCCSLVGANIVPLILGSIFNPKPDPEAVERKIKEYVDLFSAEVGNPIPPKADVQKPTEVKPSQPKDDVKKK